MIDRFASKVILGNKDAFLDEFFSIKRPTTASRKLKTSLIIVAKKHRCDEEHERHDYDECSSVGRDMPTTRNSMSSTQSFCGTLVQPVEKESGAGGKMKY